MIYFCDSCGWANMVDDIGRTSKWNDNFDVKFNWLFSRRSFLVFASNIKRGKHFEDRGIFRTLSNI